MWLCWKIAPKTDGYDPGFPGVYYAGLGIDPNRSTKVREVRFSGPRALAVIEGKLQPFGVGAQSVQLAVA